MTKNSRRWTKKSRKRSKQPGSTALSVVGGAGVAATEATYDLSALPREQALAKLKAAQKDADEAKRLVAANPRVVAAFGNMTTKAQQMWIEHATEDHLQRAAIERGLADLEASLIGPNPSQLERLLAGRVAVCYLQANFFDAMAARGDEGGIAQAEFRLKRQDRAHRRYLSALKTFAEVRRLLLPAVQVNIGGQQVNVMGATAKREQG